MKDSTYSNEITASYVNMLYKSAPLHDIGKIGISDDILLKKGKLTEDEFEQMKQHTIIGYNTLSSISDKFGEDH